MVTLQTYLVLSAFLFAVGVACMVVRRNAIQILMGVELVLNAAAINFAAFSHFTPALRVGDQFAGQAVSVFVIVLAAAEAVVGLALILSVYRLFRGVDVGDMAELKG